MKNHSITETNISRRDLLKGAGVAAGSALSGGPVEAIIKSISTIPVNKLEVLNKLLSVVDAEALWGGIRTFTDSGITNDMITPQEIEEITKVLSKKYPRKDPETIFWDWLEKLEEQDKDVIDSASTLLKRPINAKKMFMIFEKYKIADIESFFSDNDVFDKINNAIHQTKELTANPELVSSLPTLPQNTNTSLINRFLPYFVQRAISAIKGELSTDADISSEPQKALPAPVDDLTSKELNRIQTLAGIQKDKI